LSNVYELVRYALEPQWRDAGRLRIPRASDDARPDDDARQRYDDALERGALVIVPLVCANCRIGFSFLSWLGDGVERGANVTALIVRQHPHKVPRLRGGLFASSRN
jgi:hypothetical protein